MELGPRNHDKEGLWGPDSIMVVTWTLLFRSWELSQVFGCRAQVSEAGTSLCLTVVMSEVEGWEQPAGIVVLILIVTTKQ